MLQEVYFTARDLKSERDVEIIEHAVKWGLVLWEFKGDCEGEEEREGTNELHGRVYGCVREVLGQE